MSLPNFIKKTTLVSILLLVCLTTFANDNLFKQARSLQRSGEHDKAIECFKEYLLQPINPEELQDKEFAIYIDALLQLMNTYQSKGEADGCIAALEEIYKASELLQGECLRDYYSILGYALSRTERMSEAEETMLKVFTLPLQRATPERYFRDYAYAAAVFYSNTNYHNEVIRWCQEALKQAELAKNSSGAQWVKAMLGSLYKRNGKLNEALELFHASRDEAMERGDDLGVLNSLHALTDLFLYYDIPEYANLYATEAVRVEQSMTVENPMVSAQTYINKGRALHQLGERDSVALYTEKARTYCQRLPYNSGMVDVDLLSGTLLTDKGGDFTKHGIEELVRVTEQGTVVNRARAYHQLAQTYLRDKNTLMAEVMLDSLYTLLHSGEFPIFIRLDYEPILKHYLLGKNHTRAEQYTRLMLQEQQAINAKQLKFNLVESIVGLKTEQKRQELEITKLRATNQRLWLVVGTILALVVISILAILYILQKRRYVIQLKRADERFAQLSEELKESNNEKERVTQEIKEFLQDNDNRQEMETLTPFILKESGEVKFRQCFELLHPLFLHRLRERVPSITRREELLSMLIVLKQDNKEIAELLAIAPRSVLMLRHRFRQKIGIATEYSLENFIEDALGEPHDAAESLASEVETQAE